MNALVIGGAGQDGRILCERLRSSPKVHVVAVDLGDVDLCDPGAVDALVSRSAPDEVYYLAAHHHSAEEKPDDAAELRACLEVHVTGALHTLDALARLAPKSAFFYAGSSHMFGHPSVSPQTESTPFAPRNPYAITKVAGAHVCRLFRDRGVRASVGILYNHESPHRAPNFVSQRIVRGARAAMSDSSHKLILGSLDAVVDWGWAGDTVDAMMRIVRADPDDYIVATGEPHTVEDFVQIAFSSLALDWRKHVVIDPSIVKGDAPVLVGDAGKLRARTGWKPTMSFEQMVKTLVA